MAQDPQIKACLATKKFAVLSQGWTVQAASDSPEDQAVAEFVRVALTQHARAAFWMPCMTSWMPWRWASRWWRSFTRSYEAGPYAGRVGLRALKSKDPGLFLFETDAFANVTALRGADGQAYPPDKFLRYTYMPLYGNPLGQSDLRACYKPWFVKQQLLRWWAKYLEKFGMPTVTGSYDAARGYGTDQQRELLAIGRAGA